MKHGMNRSSDIGTYTNADKMAAVAKLTGEEEDGADAHWMLHESSTVIADFTFSHKRSATLNLLCHVQFHMYSRLCAVSYEQFTRSKLS